jgi:hypothetical protein
MAKQEQKTKGTSLAKGPVGLIGLLLPAYGITALIFGGHSFTQHIPNGTVHGKTWLGLEVNGWTALLFIAGGLLLLFGAPLHWGAKDMSLIVGIVLGAAALVALATKAHGVFGLLAASHVTELVWGAAGVLLIILSQLPRVGAERKQGYDDGRDERRGAARQVEPEPARATVKREPRRVEPEPTPRTVERQPVERGDLIERNGSPTNGVPTGARVASVSRSNPKAPTAPTRKPTGRSRKREHHQCVHQTDIPGAKAAASAAPACGCLGPSLRPREHDRAARRPTFSLTAPGATCLG